MGFKEHDRERWSERFERWRRPQHGLAPRERPLGDENFDQDREDWREPMEFEPRSGRLQFGGESLDRGYYPRRQSRPRESERYPREQRPHEQQPREWWRDESSDESRRYGPHAGKGPKGYRRSDERILEDVNQALHDCGALDATDVEVDCKSGEVVLKGVVADRRAKRLAEEIAEEQSGVLDVRNELRVGQAQSQSAYGQPSFSQASARARHDTER